MAVRRRIRIKKRFYVLIAAVVLVLFAAQFIRADRQIARQREQMAQLDAQILAAQEYNLSLEHQIASAGSMDCIERAAREQLGWVHQNEILYVARNAEETDAQEQ